MVPCCFYSALFFGIVVAFVLFIIYYLIGSNSDNRKNKLQATSDRIIASPEKIEPKEINKIIDEINAMYFNTNWPVPEDDKVRIEKLRQIRDLK